MTKPGKLKNGPRDGGPLNSNEIEELYLRNRDFIKGCANVICRKYSCEHMREDLISAGTIAFLEQAGRFDPSRNTELTTFLYRHILGAMRREVERSSGCVSLSKREFHNIRSAQAAYAKKQQVNVKDRDPELDGSISKPPFNTALSFLSLDDDKTVCFLEPYRPIPIHMQVFLQVSYELMRKALMEELSFKDRQILVASYGVFGVPKLTLGKIGEAFNMKANAVGKARDRALQKLTQICMEGKLGRWKWVYEAVMKAI